MLRPFAYFFFQCLCSHRMGFLITSISFSKPKTQLGRIAPPRTQKYRDDTPSWWMNWPKPGRKRDPEKRLGKIETVLERFSIGEQFQAPSIPHSYQETQGSWGVDLVEDIPGRGRSLYLVLEANRGRGNRGEPVFLVISKAPQQNLSVYIKWNSYFREIPVVEYQWDGGTWESCPQLLSPSKQTTYLDDDVSGFLSAMSSSRRLIVRTTPFASNPLLVEFKTEGFAYLASKYEDYLGPIFTQ
jgi:hypothetical protein